MSARFVCLAYNFQNYYFFIDFLFWCSIHYRGWVIEVSLISLFRFVNICYTSLGVMMLGVYIYLLYIYIYVCVCVCVCMYNIYKELLYVFLLNWLFHLYISISFIFRDIFDLKSVLSGVSIALLGFFCLPFIRNIFFPFFQFQPMCVLKSELSPLDNRSLYSVFFKPYLATLIFLTWNSKGFTVRLVWASLVAQRLKRLPAIQETWVPSLGREDPWRRKWQPTPIFLPGESHGWRSLVGYSPRGHKESDTTERPHFHFLFQRFIAAILLLIFCLFGCW